MISGLATLRLLARPESFKAIEARRPASIVVVAGLFAFKALLHQHEAGAAQCRLEAHRNFGLVPTRATLVFPGPPESETAWRLDDTIDTARRHQAAIRTPQGGAPAAALPRIQYIDSRLVPVRRPLTPTPRAKLRG